MENKIKEYVRIINDFSEFLTNLCIEVSSGVIDEIPAGFLQKNLVSIYSIEILLEGIDVETNKFYDINSISSIARNILETSVIFDVIYGDSQTKDEIELKTDLWKLIYLNSSNEKFKSIGVIDKYDNDVIELKKKIKNNKLGIEIKDSLLKVKNTELFVISDMRVISSTLSKESDCFLKKYLIQDSERAVVPNLYRNFSEQSHTTYNTVQLFVVDTELKKLEEVVIYCVIHLFTILDCFLKSFLKSGNIRVSDAGLSKYNNIVDDMNILCKKDIK